MTLSPKRAEALRPLLDGFLARFDARARIPFDPVQFPHRYERPDDIEVVGLLSASLAYGRADLFTAKLAELLRGMGPHPADYARELEPRRARPLLSGFVYRFNVGADLCLLLMGMGRLLRERCSLGAVLERAYGDTGDLRESLAVFVDELKAVDPGPLRKVLGSPRALDHLLPDPRRGGACKRLHLYLRWMARGPDGVDLGLWKLPPSALIVPVDTHIARIARYLGLTRRKDLSWRTAEEITVGLRRLDPRDPVKYDFALCHYGMSGACPPRRAAEHCERCTLLPACAAGKQTCGRSREKRDLVGAVGSVGSGGLSQRPCRHPVE